MVHQAPSLIGAPASQDAMNAVRAAKHLRQWGGYTTGLFVKKRGIVNMFTLAMVNEIELARESFWK